MKIIIKKILNKIRLALIGIRHNLIPLPRKSFEKKTPYTMFRDEQLSNCYENFKKYFKTSIFISTTRLLRSYAIKEALLNDKNCEKYFIEFGVHKGESINFFSKYVKKIYGFDSFEGLREDWHGTIDLQKRSFDINGVIPKTYPNVILIKGWVQDTVENFLIEKKPEINFVHMDLDTYESTKFVLKKIKPYLIKNCIIVFDELYNYSGWDVGEYKALSEVFNDNEYKYLAFADEGTSSVIKII
jgi:hypothetical protein